MDIKEITVAIHEKRNHPFEYGHYDCEVRLVAEATPYPDSDIDELRNIARAKVREELDDWEQSILANKEKEDRRVNVEHQIHNLSYQYGKPDYDECKNDVVSLIHECPEDEWAHFFDVLKSMEEQQACVSDIDIPF
jgi:hypothetical protein